ncbi:MAG TPA: beta-propeller fold lactonase family protein [Chthonomonadaceae bacterium]|nr:beta-propeller fold lactonase family protein [Chthonomonadaceae bacterium]
MLTFSSLIRQVAHMGVVAAVGVSLCFGSGGCTGSDSGSPVQTYLYSTNAFSYDISQYQAGRNGALSTLAPNITYSSNNLHFPGAETIVFDPSQHHAYVANLGASTIDIFTVGADGKLTRFGSVAMDPDSEPSILTFLPSGNFAYASSESNTNHKITEYRVNADGSLTLMTKLDTGSDVGHILIGPGAHFAYITSYFANTISRYTIQSDGTLSGPVGASLPTGAGPFAMTMDPASQYIYVTNLGSLRPPYAPVPGTVSEYRLNADGSLTSIGSVAAGTGPGFLTITPNGRYAYVGNLHDTTLSEYRINADGTLAPIGTPSVGNGPVQVLIDAAGIHAYVAVTGANQLAPATGSNMIMEYYINADGSLTQFGAIATGIGPDYLALHSQ